MFRIEYGTPHLIPASLIDSFPVERVHLDQKNLFDVLREHDIKYVQIEPKLNISEPKLLRRVPKMMENLDAVFVKLNSLDRLGHEYGPVSGIVKDRIRYLDRLLAELAKSLSEETALIVMSDHGMVPVYHSIDFQNHLRRKGLKFGYHYLSYIGATYASFWFRNEACKEQVMKELDTLEAGRFLTLEDRKQLELENIGSEYGEEIFAVKEHHVFFPEFYHIRKAPKGMHGYAFGKYDEPVFIMRSHMTVEKNRRRVEFVDIMPTILRLFDLPLPSSIEGKSLI